MNATPAIGLVVVLAAKGGCGGTLVATNLAAELAATHSTCLLDLDLCKGDVAGALDIHSDRTVNLLLDRLDTLDDALLRGSVDVHASGMHVLLQPYDLSDLHQVSADEARQLLVFLRDHYEMVVVDVGSRMDVVTMTALLAADEILLVTTGDVLALRDAQRMLGLLRQIDVRPDAIRLVLNRTAPANPISQDEIVAHLHTPIAATLPEDVLACERVNTHGRLLSEAAPRARLTAAFAALWPTLRGVPAPTPPPSSPWLPWVQTFRSATVRKETT